MLLWLFGASLVAAMILGVATAMAQLGGDSFAGSLLVLLGVLRALLATASLGALVMREPWGRYPPLVFLGFELLMLAAMILGLVPGGSWEGGLVAPLWNVLFVFLFLREDVQTSFEPRIRDRKDLSELLRVVEKGDRDR
jgi:hypothetical protein